jgi:LacI family transcriptional regulator
MGQRVTLEDIAHQSNVSLATVSLVLRDKPGINHETRQRVLGVARTLGYRKRVRADHKLAQQIHQIGLLTKTRTDIQLQTDQSYALIVAGIEAACRRQHINLLYATVPVDADNYPQELPRMLLEVDLDGVTLLGAFVDSTIARLMERHTKLAVLVDASAAEDVYDSVITDNFRGAYQAVAHLIAHGHRHIGLVGSLPDAYPSIAGRRRRYLRALQDHTIASPYFADSHIEPKEAANATINLLRRNPHITALFCCNDMMAVAVMQAVQAVGRRLPDDLSIVGFDNVELAEHVTPALTTMHVDKISMGRLAVQLLKNRAEFPAASCTTTMLRPTLIERQSVRSLHAGAST